MLFSYAQAEDKIFTCKPVMASFDLKNGEYYTETIDDEYIHTCYRSITINPVSY